MSDYISQLAKPYTLWAFLVAQRICLQCGRPGFDPWVGKIPWRREQLPTPVFWPVEFHGLCSPWDHKELDTTEQLSHITHISYTLCCCCCWVISVVSDPCDPIEGSPPGSPVPGILQARILAWVAISFSNAWKWKVKMKSLSRVQFLVTPWTAAYQAPLSMGFFQARVLEWVAGL